MFRASLLVFAILLQANTVRHPRPFSTEIAANSYKPGEIISFTYENTVMEAGAYDVDLVDSSGKTTTVTGTVQSDIPGKRAILSITAPESPDGNYEIKDVRSYNTRTTYARDDSNRESFTIYHPKKPRPWRPE